VISFWWLFLALLIGMFWGAFLHESGYLTNEYTGDLDE